MKFDVVVEAQYEVEDAGFSDDLPATELSILRQELTDAFPPSATLRGEFRYLDKEGKWNLYRL